MSNQEQLANTNFLYLFIYFFIYLIFIENYGYYKLNCVNINKIMHHLENVRLFPTICKPTTINLLITL